MQIVQVAFIQPTHTLFAGSPYPFDCVVALNCCR